LRLLAKESLKIRKRDIKTRNIFLKIINTL